MAQAAAQAAPRGSPLELPLGVCLLRGASAPEAAQRALAAAACAAAAACGAPLPSSSPPAGAHPAIVASHDCSAAAGDGGRRPADCVRACGLRRCGGHCGRHALPPCDFPADLYEAAAAAAATMGREFSASACWVLAYPEASAMPSHLDRAPGLTMILSLGGGVNAMLGRPPPPPPQTPTQVDDAAAYEYDAATRAAQYAESAVGERALPGQPADGSGGFEVALSSGDALLFRGDQVYHSVRSVAAEEVETPAWWRQDKRLAAVHRLGLLFRQVEDVHDCA